METIGRVLFFGGGGLYLLLVLHCVYLAVKKTRLGG